MPRGAQRAAYARRVMSRAAMICAARKRCARRAMPAMRAACVKERQQALRMRARAKMFRH